MHSWRRCRSRYVQILSTACWQPAMFQGLGKRGERRGEVEDQNLATVPLLGRTNYRTRRRKGPLRFLVTKYFGRYPSEAWELKSSWQSSWGINLFITKSSHRNCTPCSAVSLVQNTLHNELIQKCANCFNSPEYLVDVKTRVYVRKQETGAKNKLQRDFYRPRTSYQIAANQK